MCAPMHDKGQDKRCLLNASKRGFWILAVTQPGAQVLLKDNDDRIGSLEMVFTCTHREVELAERVNWSCGKRGESRQAGETALA